MTLTDRPSEIFIPQPEAEPVYIPQIEEDPYAEHLQHLLDSYHNLPEVPEANVDQPEDHSKVIDQIYWFYNSPKNRNIARDNHISELANARARMFNSQAIARNRHHRERFDFFMWEYGMAEDKGDLEAPYPLDDIGLIEIKPRKPLETPQVILKGIPHVMRSLSVGYD